MKNKFALYEDVMDTPNIEEQNAFLIGVWPEQEFENVKQHIAGINRYYAFKQDGHIALMLRYRTEVIFG